MKAKETAVIFIEFQNEFCTPGGKLHDGVKAELARQQTLANSRRLLAGARAKGCLVVHCPFVYDQAWMKAHNVCGLLAGVGSLEALLPGSWGGEFADGFAPAANEPVLKGKHACSGFTNTGLQQLLQQHGIRNVICCGFLSNVCVESTARHAYDAGYNVRVIHDATAATSQANQEYVEREIYPILGGSLTTSAFLAALK